MTSIFQHFITNLRAKIRHDTLDGKEYIVSPAAMLTHGVHKGSQGPLYYPVPELSKTPVVWNMKPVVIYHPEMNGKQISACEPAVIESRGVGFLLNTKWDDKLRTEAWLDGVKLKKLDEKLHDRVINGQPIEVSTGLFTDVVMKAGVYNGKKYVGTATNYRPDHLAILPDRVGACSIADGAGLGVTNELILNCATSMIVLNEDVMEEWYAEVNEQQLALHSMFGVSLGNGLSHGDVHRSLHKAMKAEYQSTVAKAFGGSVPSYWPGYVEDVYDDFFVYSQEENTGERGYYKRGYGVDTSQAVPTAMPKGAPEKVRKHTEYRTMDEKTVALKDVHTRNEETKMNEPTPVLTAPPPVVNATPASVVPVVPAKSPTMDDYIANAPPEMQEIFRDGVRLRQEEKTRLVSTITANAANRFTPEYLNVQSLDVLRGIAALAAPVAPASNPPAVNHMPPPIFATAPAPAANNAPATNAAPKLTAPKMDFTDRQIAKAC